MASKTTKTSKSKKEANEDTERSPQLRWNEDMDRALIERIASNPEQVPTTQELYDDLCDHEAFADAVASGAMDKPNKLTIHCMHLRKRGVRIPRLSSARRGGRARTVDTEGLNALLGSAAAPESNDDD